MNPFAVQSAVAVQSVEPDLRVGLVAVDDHRLHPWYAGILGCLDDGGQEQVERSRADNRIGGRRPVAQDGVPVRGVGVGQPCDVAAIEYGDEQLVGPDLPALQAPGQSGARDKSGESVRGGDVQVQQRWQG